MECSLTLQEAWKSSCIKHNLLNKLETALEGDYGVEAIKSAWKSLGWAEKALGSFLYKYELLLTA